MKENIGKLKGNRGIVLEILKKHYGETKKGLTQSEVCKRLAAEKNRTIVGLEDAAKYTAKIVQGGVSRDLRRLEEAGYIRRQGDEWIFLPVDDDGKREQERQLIRELDYHKETIFKFNDDAVLLSLKGGLAERARYLFGEYLGDALHDSLVVDGKLILLLAKTVDTKEAESAEVTEAAGAAEATGTIETADDNDDDEKNPTVKKIKKLVKQSFDWHREAEKGKGKIRLKK